MKKMSAKNTLIGMILIPAMFSGSVLAQIINIDRDPNIKEAGGYNVDDRGVITRNSTGLRWHTGYRNPAMAIP